MKGTFLCFYTDCLKSLPWHHLHLDTEWFHSSSQSTSVRSWLIFSLICFGERWLKVNLFLFKQRERREMEANREKEKRERNLSPNEFSLINIVIVWMERTISRELQDNVLAMFISKTNPRPFIMKIFTGVDLLRQPFYWFQKRLAR